MLYRAVAHYDDQRTETVLVIELHPDDACIRENLQRIMQRIDTAQQAIGAPILVEYDGRQQWITGE